MYVRRIDTARAIPVVAHVLAKVAYSDHDNAILNKVIPFFKSDPNYFKASSSSCSSY